MRRAVHQRRVRVIQQTGIVFTGNAVNKEVRVIARHGDHRQDAAGTRIGDHNGCTATRQQGFDILLKFEVERQIDVMPRLRRHFFQLADHASTVVNLNLFIAGLPVQNVFVVTFDPQLTDIVRSSVVGQLAVFIKAVDVFVVNLGNVANHMRQRGAVGIVATLISFHFHAGETVLIHRKAGHLDFRKIGFNRNRGEAVRAGALFFEGRDIVIVKVDNAFQRFQRILNIIDFFRHHLDLIDGAVQRQRGAVTIVNNAAAGCDRHQLNAVFV